MKRPLHLSALGIALQFVFLLQAVGAPSPPSGELTSTQAREIRLGARSASPGGEGKEFFKKYTRCSAADLAPQALCPACEGTHRILCPKCKGRKRYCPECENSGKITCPGCQGEGRLSCPRCGGSGSRQCDRCFGEGRVWVPRRFIWGSSKKKEGEKTKGKKSKKGGLRGVIPAHWEKCRKCDGQGKLTCKLCKGRKTLPCRRCRTKGWLICPQCKDQEQQRNKCRACEGRGWLPCPLCGAPKDDKQREEQIPQAVVEELHRALRSLGRSPPIIALLGLIRIAPLRYGCTVCVFSEALENKCRYVQLLALEELCVRSASALCQYGGAPLVRRLLELAGGEDRDQSQLAAKLLHAISRKYPKALIRRGGSWEFKDWLFPPGRSVPPLPAQHARKDRTPEKKRGRTGLASPENPPGELERLFGIEELTARGFDIVWVLDNSASVRPFFGDTQQAVARTSSFFTELFGDVRIGLVAYRDFVYARCPLTSRYEHVRRILEALRAEKGGDLAEGVGIALASVLSGSFGLSKKRTAAVVTVGDYGPPSVRVRRLLSRISDLKRAFPHLRIHCVVCGSGLLAAGQKKFWRALAQAGGGRMIPFKAAPELSEALAGILAPRVDPAALRRILALVERNQILRNDVPPVAGQGP